MRFASDKILHGRVQFLAFFFSEFMIYGKIFHVFKEGFLDFTLWGLPFVPLSGFYSIFFYVLFTWLRSLYLVKLVLQKKLLQRISEPEKSSV